MVRRWKTQWMALSAVLTLVFGTFAVFSIPATTAQGVQNLEGAPVGIHEGSCEDFLEEPAYDAGALEIQSLNDLRGSDDFVESGLTEIGNTLGVDVNGDGTLDDTETIGGTEDDIQVAVAQADIEDGLAEDTNWVSVVHASPDAYTTILGCGSITNAAEDDEGNLIDYIHPMGDATAFGYAVINGDRNSITTYMFEPGTAPESGQAAGAADEATPTVAEGHPVGIHSGTCADWTVEPAYDVGLMEKTNVAAEGEQEVGDTEATLPEEAATLGDVYHVDNDVDFSGSELLDEGPYVVAVHQSEDDYSTLVACGNVFDIPEDDNLIVPLLPVGDSTMTGVATISTDGNHLAGFLWDCSPVEQQEVATPAPTPSPSPTPTQPATAVIEETEVVESTEVIEVTEVVTETQVVESTEVITETEVVPAPTATAMAEEATPTETPES